MTGVTTRNQDTFQFKPNTKAIRQKVLIDLIIHAYPLRICSCTCCSNNSQRQIKFNLLLSQLNQLDNTINNLVLENISNNNNIL